MTGRTWTSLMSMVNFKWFAINFISINNWSAQAAVALAVQQVSSGVSSNLTLNRTCNCIDSGAVPIQSLTVPPFHYQQCRSSSYLNLPYSAHIHDEVDTSSESDSEKPVRPRNNNVRLKVSSFSSSITACAHRQDCQWRPTSLHWQ